MASGTEGTARNCPGKTGKTVRKHTSVVEVEVVFAKCDRVSTSRMVMKRRQFRQFSPAVSDSMCVGAVQAAEPAAGRLHASMRRSESPNKTIRLTPIDPFGHASGSVAIS